MAKTWVKYGFLKKQLLIKMFKMFFGGEGVELFSFEDRVPLLYVALCKIRVPLLFGFDIWGLG